jgi:CRP/FNR family transcriptional regulator
MGEHIPASQGLSRIPPTLQEIKMLSAASPSAIHAFTETFEGPGTSAPSAQTDGPCSAHRRVADVLKLMGEALTPKRRVVRAGDLIYRAGQRFGHLQILNAGFIKVVGHAGDGREQVVGLKFRGDWLGFDGIATGQHVCDAVAMDTSEIWSFSYHALLAACTSKPALLALLLEAMGRESAHDRDALMSICSKPADVRVAEFLCCLAQSLDSCGMRSDQITLRLTRAEIGDYLGMRLETVSRVMSKLVRAQLIRFTEKRRQDVHIPDLAGLETFVQACLARTSASRDPGLITPAPATDALPSAANKSPEKLDLKRSASLANASRANATSLVAPRPTPLPSASSNARCEIGTPVRPATRRTLHRECLLGLVGPGGAMDSRRVST